MKQDQIEKHSTTQSVILHLLPGILVGCFYLLARQPVVNSGKVVHIYGTLVSNAPDYNGSQILVDRIEAEE